jgi:uncharacterized phage protein (TIGR02218 family)
VGYKRYQIQLGTSMKRLMSAALIAALQTNLNVIRADLFVITLPTGTVMYVTDGQFDITLPAGTLGFPATSPAVNTTFLAATYGRWTRGSITSEAGFSLSANSMTLTCVPQPTTVYPGTTVGILNAVFNGLFDAATISVYTTYFALDNYGACLANSVEVKFFGFIEKITDVNRTKVEFEVQDPLFVLNEKVPKRVIQSNCPWGFGDVNCNPPGGLAAFTQAFTAKAGSTQTVLTPVSAFAQAAGYFTQGVVACTAGANVGLSATVKLHDATGNLNVVLPWLFLIVAGDTFVVVAGCDKTAPTCITKFNNKIHFGGAISVPVPSQAA